MRLPGKGNLIFHGARPVHRIIWMIKWIWTSRLSIKNSLSSGFLVSGFGFRVSCFGYRVQGSGFRVQDSGFRVLGARVVVRQKRFRVSFFKLKQVDTSGRSGS